MTSDSINEQKEKDRALACAIYNGGLTQMQRRTTPPLPADDLLGKTTSLHRGEILRQYFLAGVKHCNPSRALKEAAPDLSHLTSVEAVQEALNRRTTGLAWLLSGELHQIVNTAADFLGLSVEAVLQIALQKFFADQIHAGNGLGYVAHIVHERYLSAGAEEWSEEPGPLGRDTVFTMPDAEEDGDE